MVSRTPTCIVANGTLLKLPILAIFCVLSESTLGPLKHESRCERSGVLHQGSALNYVRQFLDRIV